MTHFEDRNRRGSGLSLIVFGPVLALATFTALLALLAGLFGWHPNQMLVTSAAVGAAVVVAALGLVYRQITKRHAAEGALQDVEARVASIVESAMDAVITVDEKQRVVMFNAAAEAMFGCPRGQAIGAPLAWFIPERFRAEHERHIRRFGETGISSRRMGAQRIVAGLRSGGREFPIDASISQITEGGKKFYTVILRDVTERVQAEEALRRAQARCRLPLRATPGRGRCDRRKARGDAGDDRRHRRRDPAHLLGFASPDTGRPGAGAGRRMAGAGFHPAHGHPLRSARRLAGTRIEGPACHRG